MDIKKGDRVKVTIEGEVSYVGETWLTINHNHDVAYKEPGAMVEKIEPPVEVFKPGDVVRVRGWEGEGGLLHLAHGGYINEYHTLFQRDREWMEKEFTSERYEKVDL